MGSKISHTFRLLRLSVGSLLLSVGLQAQAYELGGVDFSGSGFFTIAAGKILKGTHNSDTDLDYHCPCFISDYGQGGVYEAGHWRGGPDSKLGLQGSASINNGAISLTGQVVSRGAVNGAMNLEWLYATFELNSHWTVQIGRKRLPLFLYSETQDVGYTYPWVHLPPQLYGWETVNYNGANILYRDQWGKWTAVTTVFAGNETKKDAGYWKIYNGKFSQTDVRWSDIIGADLKLSRAWFEGRLVYIQSNTQNKITSDDEFVFGDPKKQRIYGFSFSIEKNNWISKNEFLYIDRTADYGRDSSQLVSIGRRIGNFTPFVSYSKYTQITKPDLGNSEGHSTTSFVLRYDFNNASAFKVQYDFWHDTSAGDYESQHGNAHLLSISYDYVF